MLRSRTTWAFASSAAAGRVGRHPACQDFLLCEVAGCRSGSYQNICLRAAKLSYGPSHDTLAGAFWRFVPGACGALRIVTEGVMAKKILACVRPGVSPERVAMRYLDHTIVNAQGDLASINERFAKGVCQDLLSCN